MLFWIRKWPYYFDFGTYNLFLSEYRKTMPLEILLSPEVEKITPNTKPNSDAILPDRAARQEIRVVILKKWEI